MKKGQQFELVARDAELNNVYRSGRRDEEGNLNDERERYDNETIDDTRTSVKDRDLLIDKMTSGRAETRDRGGGIEDSILRAKALRAPQK